VRHLAVVGLAALAGVMLAPDAGARTRVVSSESGFRIAVSQMRASGGVVVVRAGSYGTLAVTNRAGRWLTVRARPGVSVRNLVIRNAARVRLVDVRVKGGRLNVHSSRQVKLERVRIVRSRMSLAAANFVTISRSQFTRCGENREACLATGWGDWASSHVRVIASRFYDCYGCDFIRGRIGTGFVLRGSILERAVPGPCGAEWECNHQDGVQIGAGREILIEGNRFGLTAYGAGQLYFSQQIDGLTIRNNVFFGTDATLPDWIGWAAIIVGNHVVEEHFPRHVAIVNNTILTGSPRPDGLANSVYLSPSYANIPVEERPLIANNVLGLLRNPERLCTLGGVVIANAVKDGAACIEGGIVGDPMLDEWGVPLEGSVVVDQADPAWATVNDLRGWARDATPDIGAFEFRT
jgi:hypothetical protein